MAEVHVERQGAISIVTLDNPPVNVINQQMAQELADVVEELHHDRTVLAVIFTGAGEKAFAAGADIKAFPNYIQYGNAEQFALALDMTMTKLHQLGKPTIAALNGLTLGAGCELALACDFRVADEDVRIGLPEAKLGLFPGAGGTQRLPRLIGESRAKQLIFTGEPITAAEACQIGLVNKVAPKGQSLAEALRLAATFEERSLASLELAKQAIDEGLGLCLDDGLRLEARLFGQVFTTSDAAEGVTAFIEKRAPKFTHK